MYELEKSQMIKAGLKLDRYGLIALSGGNVSLRMENNQFLVTPSGMNYDDLTPDDILLVDKNGNILEGTRKKSVDTEALLYIYNKRPDVNAIIHTHQPYATALGLVTDRVDCDLTTLANATKGSVNVAPYRSAGTVEMGMATIDYIGEQLAVILKHHGVIAIGDSLKQALYACIYLEEAAKTLAIAKACGQEIAKLTEEQIAESVAVFDRYGQNKG